MPGSHKAKAGGDVAAAPLQDANHTDRRLAVAPRRAWRMLDIGPTRGYELLAAGELASYVDGRSRRITVASIEGFVARRLAASNSAGLRGHLVEPAVHAAKQKRTRRRAPDNADEAPGATAHQSETAGRHDRDTRHTGDGLDQSAPSEMTRANPTHDDRFVGSPSAVENAPAPPAPPLDQVADRRILGLGRSRRKQKILNQPRKDTAPETGIDRGADLTRQVIDG